MRTALNTLLALSFCAVPARGVDLNKIERTLTKEPVYKNCLLVFGLEAKARAWLVIDGNMLYLDRNCDGRSGPAISSSVSSRSRSRRTPPPTAAARFT